MGSNVPVRNEIKFMNLRRTQEFVDITDMNIGDVCIH